MSNPGYRSPNRAAVDGHRVLVVEDDRAIVDFVSLGLGYEGFVVTHAASIDSAQELMRSATYDIALFDLTLPDGSGLQLLKSLRSRGSVLPVLILTAQADVDIRVEGLDAGADDYVVKPFRFDELLARMRAVLRRSSTASPAVVTCGDIALDVEGYRVEVAGRPVDVTGLEFQLLELLLANAGRVLTREVLMDRVWGPNHWTAGNVLESRVSRLRRALGAAGGQIQTVRGVGYILRPSA